MRSQAQYTIYALNDIETSATAPSNPYKGQVWQDTSTDPPTMKVWNGSEWKEQNGTDEIRTSVKTVTEKEADLETTVSGLSSTVSETTKTVETIEDDLGDAEENITSLQSDVSTLQQTTTDISAEVSNKVDNAYGSSESSFGWSLKSDGFYVYSNKATVVSITSSGLSVAGAIDATSGSIGNLTIDGQLTFGGNSKYYINPNYNDGAYYICLPGFKVDDASGAVFSGKLSAPSGTIGGFTIGTTALTVGTWGSNGSAMLCTGSTDSKSIGGSGSISGWTITSGSNFGVTSDGILYATAANITGALTASSGNFENCDIQSSCNIYGYLYMSGSEDVKFYGTKMTMNYESWTGGTGTATTITHTKSSTSHTSYAYSRPFGMTIVPQSYTSYAEDGMIFGVMETYSFKTQNLLCGASFYYANDGTNIISETLIKCCDNTVVDALYNSSTGDKYITWGNSLQKSKMAGNWYPGESTSQYITSYSMNSIIFGCLYGNWLVTSQMYFGTSTTGYQARHDADQVTFYYNSVQVGELEAYSSYTDVQGTWKTNGSAWISSSDRNLKEDISDIAEVYDTLFDKLLPVTYKWKAGTSGRTHVGFIAQDVKDATEASGLTTKEFAAYVHFEAAEKEGETIPETCGIRYEEITPLNTWEIQKLKKRVEALEQKIKELEDSL